MSKRPTFRHRDVAEVVANAQKITRRTGFTAGLAIGAVITVLVAIFIFQNNDKTDLSYLGTSFNVPLWMGLLAAFVAGCVASPLLTSAWRRHRAHVKANKQAAKDVKQLGEKLSN